MKYLSLDFKLVITKPLGEVSQNIESKLEILPYSLVAYCILNIESKQVY